MAGVELLVINRRLVSPEQMARLHADSTHLAPVFSDPVGIEVFRLRRWK